MNKYFTFYKLKNYAVTCHQKGVSLHGGAINILLKLKGRNEQPFYSFIIFY